MKHKKQLFTPGPSNVPDPILEELSKDVIHHRMGDYKKILEDVTGKLKSVFKTSEDVLILTSSGTGAMESSIVNLFSKGDHVLVINTGNFGDRYIEIAEVFGLKVSSLKYEWGNTYSLAEVKQFLADNTDVKGILMTYHETSTGVLNDVKRIGELTKDTDTLLITDCISGMIVHPFEFDQWNVDCAVASSQKGFLLPPGISFVSISKKAQKQMERSNLPKYYWDYKKYYDYLKKGQPPFTPAIQLIVGLNKALTYILEKGVTTINTEKQELRTYTEERFKEIGFTLFIEDESIRGNVLVPVVPTNKDLDIKKLTKILDETYDLSVSKGQGQYVTKMLRIGILSEIGKDDIDDLIGKIKAIV
ncbi:pyridoxal-phosphate-dependent aminotransferase family protein [Haloplasma contractile]|uniref:Serine-pyruvate transaminase protein n=1 Tax=Haloplasma contractile SSD-17B TaxID=1033810 RepID=F7PT18_9MOLU|nr:alanine--glyoxylate aminotransferase family protein [Haloplasma contractile]ERJ12570.1 serine-pyruvate transaminase protein [Haloplasma contractile SSD-17B]